MGQAPISDGVSLRTFNRNFKGRCGTISAEVYLVSPEVAAISAINGYITSTLEYTKDLNIIMPEKFLLNDNLIINPAKVGENIEIIRGPNIKPFPKAKALSESIIGKALIIVGDDITTDHIMPSNAKLLPYRSNIPYLSDYCLVPCDEEFPRRAKKYDGGIIIAGFNYGQGSSREHAALVPLYLGIKAVIAKSFARIHKQNLINNGILPLVFENESDFDHIGILDELVISDMINQINEEIIIVNNKTKNKEYKLNLNITERQRDMLNVGGLLNLKGEK